LKKLQDSLVLLGLNALLNKDKELHYACRKIKEVLFFMSALQCIKILLSQKGLKFKRNNKNKIRLNASEIHLVDR